MKKKKKSTILIYYGLGIIYNRNSNSTIQFASHTGWRTSIFF